MSLRKYSRHLIDTEERDHLGRTLLLQALDVYDFGEPPSLEAITTLLDWDADITARDLDGDTCLHVAMIGIRRVGRWSEDIEERWRGILTILIRSGADPWARNFSNETVPDIAYKTPESWACGQQRAKTIEMLLNAMKSCGYII
jgi:ankyrin repeat protein